MENLALDAELPEHVMVHTAAVNTYATPPAGTAARRRSRALPETATMSSAPAPAVRRSSEAFAANATKSTRARRRVRTRAFYMGFNAAADGAPGLNCLQPPPPPPLMKTTIFGQTYCSQTSVRRTSCLTILRPQWLFLLPRVLLSLHTEMKIWSITSLTLPLFRCWWMLSWIPSYWTG